jgi:hypothetical protein
VCVGEGLSLQASSAARPPKNHGPASRRPRPSAESTPLSQPLYCLSTRPTSPPYPAPQLLFLLAARARAQPPPPPRLGRVCFLAWGGCYISRASRALALAQRVSPPLCLRPCQLSLRPTPSTASSTKAGAGGGPHVPIGSGPTALCTTEADGGNYTPCQSVSRGHREESEGSCARPNTGGQ